MCVSIITLCSCNSYPVTSGDGNTYQIDTILEYWDITEKATDEEEEYKSRA